MTTKVSLVAIAVECPEPDCDSVLRNRNLEQTVFAHLVEKHGVIDTLAHVLAYEATASLAR